MSTIETKGQPLETGEIVRRIQQNPRSNATKEAQVDFDLDATVDGQLRSIFASRLVNPVIPAYPSKKTPSSYELHSKTCVTISADDSGFAPPSLGRELWIVSKSHFSQPTLSSNIGLAWPERINKDFSNNWKIHLINRCSKSGQDELIQTADRVLSLLDVEGPIGLNLFGLEPDLVNAEHLALVLRLSFSFRDEVPGWGDALNVAATALERSGSDPRDLLSGLMAG